MENSSDKDSLREKRVIDRLETRDRMAQMAVAGREILADTHLVLEGEITHSDVEAVHRYLTSGVPITPQNYRLIDHLMLTGNTAREIAFRMGMNPDELEVLGNLHDDGKRATFLWNRNELAADIVHCSYIGIRKELLNKIPSVREEVDFVKALGRVPTRSDVQSYLNQMSKEKRILTIADILSKRIVADWSIQPFSDVMQYHYESRGAVLQKVLDQERDEDAGLKSFPSERILTSDYIDFAGMLYEELYQWLMEEQIDPVFLQKEIQRRELLSPVRAVLFDLGKVVIKIPDDTVVSTIKKSYGMKEEDFSDIWLSLLTELQKGTINENEMWDRLATRLGRNPNRSMTGVMNEGWSTVPYQDVLEIIRQLRKNGKINIGAFSDTNHSHIKKIMEELPLGLFDRVIASPDIHVTKADVIAHRIAALNFWLPPQACLLIDDKEVNIQKAQEAGLKAVQFDATKDSVEMLREELNKNGLQL